MPALSPPPFQLSFEEFGPATAGVEALPHQGDEQSRGAVYTRREVVNFILDLCGYTDDQPLHQRRLLEPSCGAGDFLLPAVERLLTAWRRYSGKDALHQLGSSILAVELHQPTFLETREKLRHYLDSAGLSASISDALTKGWLVSGDFLLAELPHAFDLVIGNPPYVRQELIPDVLLAEYRRRYSTLYDRADLYIPFIERSLRSLTTGGILGFICADRWMKNRYGGPLRALVAAEFHLRTHVDMTDTPSFSSDVIAYPAVTIIARESGGPTRVAVQPPQIDANALKALHAELTAPALSPSQTLVRELDNVASHAEPWVLGKSDQMALLRRLERQFPALEEAGCKVGIGVATGADKAFIGPWEALDVEPDRKVPLAMTADLRTGKMAWRGMGVINPFKDGPGSGLVNLDDYPRLRRHLESHRTQIAARHVARRNPAQWYRTIDRITEALTTQPKLLVPDIKGQAQIVFDPGQFYPHHNLYYITSDTWDLRALQAVLLSKVAQLFVASYSTRMRGGFLRYQAQYLRRIRVPHWQDVPSALRQQLQYAAEKLDLPACNEAARWLYDLSAEDIDMLESASAQQGD